MFLLNADFSKFAVVKPRDYQWVKSPSGEVERVMLDRIGNEAARATSLVKYAPLSLFPKHQHPHGEEILVLSGMFTEDGSQHYQKGWYLRNPHNSSHIPSSEMGTLIFVKLRQMSETETEAVRIDTHNPNNWKKMGHRDICELYQSQLEHTYLEKIMPLHPIEYDVKGGAEILVIEGEISHSEETYPTGSWLRIPPQADYQLQSGQQGATLYLKTGHLLAMIQSTHKI